MHICRIFVLLFIVTFVENYGFYRSETFPEEKEGICTEVVVSQSQRTDFFVFGKAFTDPSDTEASPLQRRYFSSAYQISNDRQ